MPGIFQITLKLFVYNPEGKLLVLKDRKSGLGDLPGGRIDQGEIYSPLPEILRREVKEELGEQFHFTLQPEEIYFTFPVKMWINGHEALGIAFRGRSTAQSQIQLSEEHSAGHWIDIHSYNPEALFQGDMLQAYRQFVRRETAQ